MRGTFLSTASNTQGLRFIPAYAGNILHWRTSSNEKAVHPRVCGEHRENSQHHASLTGSSPRMRGTSRYAAIELSHTRFIPAYAGNILLFMAKVTILAVHPRVCGEHNLQPLCLCQNDGSSPRMRGTLSSRRYSVYRVRFIPAYAGNISSNLETLSIYAVHPRVCGEHMPHCHN